MATTSTKKRSGLSLKAREARLAYALVIPTFIIVFMIILFPIVWNVVLSFQPVRMGDLADLNLLDFSKLTLENYEDAITARGGRFWDNLWTTVIYTVGSTVLAILLGLWAALVMKETFRGRSIARGVLLIPYIAPVISSAFVWRLMLDKNIGLVNVVGSNFGMEPLGWLTTRTHTVSLFGLEVSIPLALTTIIFFEAWRYFPFAYLFILARLQAVPSDLYEASAVDGATPSQRLWYITLPQLTAVIGTLFLLRFIWTFNKFEDIFLLNGGAAGTEVITIRVFDWLFSRRNIGVASATAVFLAVILIILVIIYYRFVLPREED